MNKQAFKLRMQDLKSYREQNPDKGYIEWKASLPDNLLDESSYNLYRAYELGYEPETVKGDSLKHLPTRDYVTGEILKKPWHPTFLMGLLEDAKLGYYPLVVDGTTYTTTWKGNENPTWKYVNGGEVGDEEKQYLTNWFNKRRLYAKEKMPVMNRQLDDLQSRMTTSTYDTVKYRETGHPYYAKGLDLVPISIDNYKVKLTDPNARGYYHPNEGIVLSDDYQKWSNREPLLHEASHVLNSNADAVHKLINTIIQGAEMRDRGLKLNEYMSRPEEIHSRLMEFRKLNNLDPTKMYGIPDIKKWRREGKDANILDNFKDDNVILDLINTVANNKSKIIKAARGGEIPPANKPILPAEKIPYKGKLYKDRYGKQYTEYLVDDYYNNSSDEIDRFTGRPFVKGLKGAIDLEDAANATPLGDVVSAYDVYDAARNNDWAGAGLAALSMLPFVPQTVKQFRKNYKGITPKVKTRGYDFNMLVRPNYVLDRINEASLIDEKNLAKRTKAVNQSYNIAERLMDDPEYMNRARLVKNQFGDDYITPYTDIIQKYNTDPSLLPNVSVDDLGGKVGRMENNMGKYNYRLDPVMTDLNEYLTEHEYGHYVDFMRNKNKLDAEGDSNMFYQMGKDLSSKPIDKSRYYMKPSELKAHMNLLREYMFENGYITKRGLKVSEKMLQKALTELSEIPLLRGVYKASTLFKDLGKYTKWFNSIPLLGIGAAAVYKNNNEQL